MSGYTPLFDSLTRGTLCGRWPDIGLWPIILSLADKNGIVDVTPLYIAGITGLSVDEVVPCMRRFCEPDPYSRSQDHEGRRLVLLDNHRDWGWRVVNHGKYREKARLAAKNARDVESGKEAERKKSARDAGESPPMSADVRRNPPVSDPSNANANANAGKTTTGAPRPDDSPEFAEFKSLYPKRGGSQPWSNAWKAIRARLREQHTWAEILEGVRRYAAFVRATGKENTEHVLQAATFCGPSKRFLEPFDIPPNAGERRLQGNLSAAEEFKLRTDAG